MARSVRLSPDQILNAAEKVFARRGYGETSLRQLMAAARVSTTAFYARFPSKEAVLVALGERLLGELHRAVGAALVGVKSRADGVERGADAVVATLAEHRRLTGLILGEGLASEGVRRGLATAYRALADLLAAQIVVAVGAAGVRADEPTGVPPDARESGSRKAGRWGDPTGVPPDARESGSRKAGRWGDPSSLAWAFVGAVQIQVLRWAVFEEIDRDGLSTALRQIASTLLPSVPAVR